MNARITFRSPARWCALLGAGLLGSGAALAQDEMTALEKYKESRQICQAMEDAAERKNCMREAGAALQAARRGNLALDVSPQERRENALSRCEVHVDPIDQQACERMVRGEGTQTGSVEEGAVVTEIVTRVVGERPSAPATMPAPSPAPMPSR